MTESQAIRTMTRFGVKKAMMTCTVMKATILFMVEKAMT